MFQSVWDSAVSEYVSEEEGEGEKEDKQSAAFQCIIENLVLGSERRVNRTGSPQDDPEGDGDNDESHWTILNELG